MAITWESMPNQPRCHSKGIAITLPLKSKASSKGKPEVKVLLLNKQDNKEVQTFVIISG